MPLTKANAMAYMARRGEPVTAKELSIDLDSRASTASELLERMTAQGLSTRDPKQRPREYTLTDAGRECLAWFRIQNGAACELGGNGTDLRPLPVIQNVSDSAELTLREI